MPRLSVRTTATAVVDEEWIIDVSEEQAALLDKEPWEFETLLVDENIDVVGMENLAVRAEEDRNVTSITRIPDDAL